MSDDELPDLEALLRPLRRSVRKIDGKPADAAVSADVAVRRAGVTAMPSPTKMKTTAAAVQGSAASPHKTSSAATEWTTKVMKDSSLSKRTGRGKVREVSFDGPAGEWRRDQDVAEHGYLSIPPPEMRSSRTVLGEIPILPRHVPAMSTVGNDLGYRGTGDDVNEMIDSVSATSNNRQSPRYHPCIISPHSKLPHVDSVVLELERLAIGKASHSGTSGYGGQSKHNDIEAMGARRSPRKAQTQAGSRSTTSDLSRSGAKRSNSAKLNTSTSRFVLKEAHCVDDAADSEREDSDDEDTDLSGFIVDDDADLSIYISSDAADSASDGEVLRRKSRNAEKQASSQGLGKKKRLCRGSPARRKGNAFEDGVESESDMEGTSNKENELDENLERAMKTLDLNINKRRESIEVVDLTASPEEDRLGTRLAMFKLTSNTSTVGLTEPPRGFFKNLSDNTDPFEDFDGILRFLPPGKYSPTKKMPSTTEDKLKIPNVFGEQAGDSTGETVQASTNKDQQYTTPPATPSRSPSKSKLQLSPSKRTAIPKSPHRQSTEAFWDLDVVNRWNDHHSPKKAPLTSPRKALARFHIFEDSENDDLATDSDDDRGDAKNDVSQDSLPSPCSSPTKSPVKQSRITASPVKSPSKTSAEDRALKKRLTEERKAEKLRKAAFEANKEKLANILLNDLDNAIARGKLAMLSASTGGVSIIWSKTLRSTAGRANWRRTVTKSSNSPVKVGLGGKVVGEGEPGSLVTVQHYASIELAKKVIDSEERLVNTLAHEFCHLANFMVSGVRDNPHGKEFKTWAEKVTRHLRQDPDPVRRMVDVTTKHGYAINHKYLWVCVGREQNAAQAWLKIDHDGACGAEYGRHSKSIDVEKQRCGRCKGRLLQVRPKPRAENTLSKSSPKKEPGQRSEGKKDQQGEKNGVTGLKETLEILDLKD